MTDKNHRELVTIPVYLSQAIGEGFETTSFHSENIRLILKRLLHLGFAISFQQYQAIKGYNIEVTQSLVEALNTPNPSNILRFIQQLYEMEKATRTKPLCPEIINILTVNEKAILTRTLSSINTYLIPSTILEEDRKSVV